MELAIFKNTTPIKSISENDLNTLLMGSFIDWLSNTLSLNEDALNKLEYALPAIKEHCWSMGFPEIKKMIEMYADGKLSVKPIPNHFDRIKLGEVANAYKQQKPRKKIKPMPEPTQEEKDLLIYQGLIFCFDNWEQTGEIINGQLWIHEHLMELGLLEFTDIEKKAMWNLALKDVLEKSKDLPYHEAKDIIKELENKNSTIRINEYKRVRLKRYFSTIEHIRDVL